MNLFTIITTILGLLIDFLSLFFSLKGNSQTSNVTFIYSTSSETPYSPSHNIKQENQKTLKGWISTALLLMIIIILVLTAINTWNNFPVTDDLLTSLANRLYYTLYVSIGYTTKLICFSVIALLLGTIAKNIKNKLLPFRFFNIIIYGISTILFIWFICLTFNVDYSSVLSNATLPSQAVNNTNTLFAFLLSLLRTSSPAIIMIQIIFVTYAIIYLSITLLFNEEKSLLIATTAKIIFQKILFILIPGILILYWTYVWK